MTSEFNDGRRATSPIWLQGMGSSVLKSNVLDATVAIGRCVACRPRSQLATHTL